MEAFPQGLPLQPPAMNKFPVQPQPMNAVQCRQDLAMAVLLRAPSS